MRTKLYTTHYPADTAAALAEEFGSEAKVWIRSSLALEEARKRDGSGLDWELTACALAYKAAHFGAMALDAEKL